MSERGPNRRSGAAPDRLIVVVLAFCALGVTSADQASAGPTIWAFPSDPAAGGTTLSCLPVNPFCAVGEAAGAVVTDVWVSAMLSLWDAGLWLLGLAFAVIDALTTPDLSAAGPLVGVYPVTFGIGATLAAMMAMAQLGAAALRRDGQSLGRLLVGLVQFGLVWVGYVAIAALLVTGVSGVTTGLLQGLLGIDSFAQFDPSISIARDVVDGSVATVLGISSIFMLVPASVGYLLLMLVREAALIVLAATSAISAGGLLAQSSSTWFWRSLRWFVAALLVAPVAVLVLGVGVTITEGIVTGAEQTSTEAAIGMAVVGCLLILLGALCPLTLFRLLAFVDPGTSSGAALRQSLAASGGVMGALQNLGNRAGGGASGGVAASGAAASMAGDRAQGESTADAATSARFAGPLRALATGTAQAGRLAAGVAASAADVLSAAGVGHAAPYYGQSSPHGAGTRSTGHAARAVGSGRGTSGLADGDLPAASSHEGDRSTSGHPVGGEGAPVVLPWPAQHLDGVHAEEPGDDGRPGGEGAP